MKLRAAFASCCAVALLAALPAAHAGDKRVKFNLHNDTGTQLELKVGDKLTVGGDEESFSAKAAGERGGAWNDEEHESGEVAELHGKPLVHRFYCEP